MIVTAFCANMIVVSHTTALSVLGAGLALRGPDGSMVTATDGLYEERKSVFFTFGIGLTCTVGSLVMCVWLVLNWEAAFITMSITLYTISKIYKNYRKVVRRFGYDESETVNFDDIFHGPAAIQVVQSGLKSLQKTLAGNSRKVKNGMNGNYAKHVNDNEEEFEDNQIALEKNASIKGSKRRNAGRIDSVV
jgi:hypothetical protein